jgi:ribosomal protein S18 acetylase RimI-like enzyme
VTADTEPGTPAVDITEVTEITDEVVEAFVRLIPQLSSSSPPTSRDELAAIIASEATVLFVARDTGGSIVGSLTLAVFRIPTGFRAWIEDVVVDGSARGGGVGEGLVDAAVRRSRELGAKTVDLTSRPSREAANRLYVRLGFESRSTNIYRRTLDVPAEES